MKKGSSRSHLTDEGTRLISAAEPTFAADLAELIDGVVSPERPDEATQTLSALRAALARAGVGLPTG